MHPQSHLIQRRYSLCLLMQLVKLVGQSGGAGQSGGLDDATGGNAGRDGTLKGHSWSGSVNMCSSTVCLRPIIDNSLLINSIIMFQSKSRSIDTSI